MLIKKDTFTPRILTIPDDTALFSVLNPEGSFSRKFIMENFVNFYCYRDKLSDVVFYRFEDSMGYESIDGLDSFFIPIDLVKKYYIDFDFFIHLLIEDYYFLVPIDKNYINFYGKGAEGTHLMFVYGADTRRKHLLCKDFSSYSFSEFEVPFKAVKKGVTNYFRPFSQTSDGLWFFRINSKVSPVIEYAKVQFEFNKLRQKCSSHDKGYGLGAIDLYLNEMQDHIHDINHIMSWYVIANYLRESAKLMKTRYYILAEEMKGLQRSDGILAIQNLVYNTDLFFFNVYRIRERNIAVSQDIFNKLAVMANICKDAFELVADFFARLSNTFN